MIACLIGLIAILIRLIACLTRQHDRNDMIAILIGLIACLIRLIACLTRQNDRSDMIACLIRLIASLIPTCDRTTSPSPRPRALIATDDLPLHASAHRSASAWQVRHPFRRVQGCADDHVRLHHRARQDRQVAPERAVRAHHDAPSALHASAHYDARSSPHRCVLRIRADDPDAGISFGIKYGAHASAHHDASSPLASKMVRIRTSSRCMQVLTTTPPSISFPHRCESGRVRDAHQPRVRHRARHDRGLVPRRLTCQIGQGLPSSHRVRSPTLARPSTCMQVLTTTPAPLPQVRTQGLRRGHLVRLPLFAPRHWRRFHRAFQLVWNRPINGQPEDH
jgi:hypothetical protein